MADFKAGDRVVKMSGFSAGKYGTVNSVREDGTLNVTFDGERLPRYCDPERCGQVATNAKFKVGDVVTAYGFPGKCRIVQDDGRYNPANEGWYGLKPLKGGAVFSAHERDIKAANFRAANAARNGERWTPDEKRAIAAAYHPNGGAPRWGSHTVEFIHSQFGKYFVIKEAEGRYKVSFTPTDPYEKGWMKSASSIDEVNRIMGTWTNSRAANAANPTGADIARFWKLAKAYHDGGISASQSHELNVLEDKFLWDVTDVNPRATSWSGNPPKVSKSPWAHESWSVWKNAARNAVARNAGRFELVEHNMGRSFGVYDSATSGYIADDIPLRDALRILKTKGETAEQAKKDLDWTDPAAIDRLW